MFEKRLVTGKLAGEKISIRRYHSALGWEYDSGDYHTALDKALKAVDYAGLRDEQKRNCEAFARGETRKLMGMWPSADNSASLLR